MSTRTSPQKPVDPTSIQPQEKPARLTTAELEARRLKAIKLFEQGLIPAKVGYLCEVSRQTALRWRDQWKAGDPLLAVPKTGRPKMLTEGARAAALSMFLESGATVQQFHNFIALNFKVEYTEDHARVLMKRWGIPVIKRKTRTKQAKQALASSERATAGTEVRE